MKQSKALLIPKDYIRPLPPSVEVVSSEALPYFVEFRGKRYEVRHQAEVPEGFRCDLVPTDHAMYDWNPAEG